jgi:hypothetical protein
LHGAAFTGKAVGACAEMKLLTVVAALIVALAAVGVAVFSAHSA